MSYYVKSMGRTATFKLLGPKKEKLKEVNGTQRGLHPTESGSRMAGELPVYPLYEVITVNGITEAIEHRRMEPIFYVTDDPAILAKLGISRAN
jgi:hypothetical protein